jgi:hypothetical protein
MAHYALINKDNIVVQVITGVDEDVIQTDADGTQIGGSAQGWELFYSSLPWFEGLTCKRTSYNRNIRGNFASVGYTYDSEFDIFIKPQPFPSWKLDYTSVDWKPPIERPEYIEGHRWAWSETNQEWVSVLIA